MLKYKGVCVTKYLCQSLFQCGQQCINNLAKQTNAISKYNNSLLYHFSRIVRVTHTHCANLTH